MSTHSKIIDSVYQTRWAVAQTADQGATNEYRVLVDSTQVQMRAGAIGGVNAYWKFNLANGNTEHRFAAGSQVRVGDGGAGESPRMSLVEPGGFGALLKFVTSGGQAFEVRNIFDNNFIIARASSFEINSDARGKHDILDAPIAGALAQLEQIKPRKFRRKHSGDRPVLGKDGQVVAVLEEDGPEEIGVLAQELPDFLRTGSAATGFNVDVMRWLLLLTAAVVESNGRGKA